MPSEKEHVIKLLNQSTKSPEAKAQDVTVTHVVS